MAALTLEQLIRGLRFSFQQETSERQDDWNEDFPSTGHCHLVSLILHELFGGRILKGTVNGEIIHYWNVIDDVSIDATFDQFVRVDSISDVVDATLEELTTPTTLKRDALFRKLASNLVVNVT